MCIFLVYGCICYSKLILSTEITSVLLGKRRSMTILHISSLCPCSKPYWVSLKARPRALPTSSVIAAVPHINWEVTQKLFKPPSERLRIQPLVYITVSKFKKKKKKDSAILSFAYLQNASSVLCNVWHEERWAVALFLSWTFLYADLSYYRITSWQNNAWQELIKNCNMNPCRAHWGKFVIGTVFLCLHEQKPGLTVSLISSFGSVWTHCYSAWLFLQFSRW